MKLNKPVLHFNAINRILQHNQLRGTHKKLSSPLLQLCPHPMKSVAKYSTHAYNQSFKKGMGIGVGHFITFEGIEGCGKSTQIRLLGECLQSRGYRVVMTREPGGCPIADKIRAILLDADNSAMSPLSELLLYSAARAQHVSEVILPALEADCVVLCDRFTDATIAYQSAGRGIERNTIETLNRLACSSIAPEITVLLDCDVQIGLGRARARIEAAAGPREERFELESLEFHQRVRDSYLDLAMQQPQRFLKISAGGSVEEVSAIIANRICTRLADSHAIC